MRKFIDVSLVIVLLLLYSEPKNVNAVNDVTYKTNWFETMETLKVKSQNSDYDKINEEFQSVHSEYIIPLENEILENESLPNHHKDLTLFGEDLLNVDKMNKYILSTAPKNSPFIGRGEMFINIGNELSVNPYYIYAHASVESGYGLSNIALTKGNYFGIGAFNSDTSKAYRFIDSKSYDRVYTGIYNGTKWIKENYFDRGLNTLNKMISGKRKYAVYDDDTPNYSWMYDISSLMNYN